ncbi:penicillin-binding protein 1C [Maritimibacter sp. DP07]|uniref:peptidoglycan glycosyltransferase n=1 Tax=Maritimibacter harenae TaxID=2606218 RepID=A0A845M348_9RHOB|nr:penicillin-binding protein 1C [Maritimibacter harenae]MZR13642.1 penicillin-binding protein 1C [Maritimibacter harenae]
MRLWPGLLLVGALLSAAAGRDAVDDWVARTELPPLTVETSDEVLDRDGRLLRAYTVADGRWRLGLDGAPVDPLFLDLLIAYEDKRFRRHHGVDPFAVARAAGQAVANGGVVSGASTLTMQTARLLEDGPTGTLPGKLRQVRVALALEQRLTKDEILALYLDRAPYGGNTEGIRAATRAWFGKEPGRLTPAEAALLVALPQSPETRRPDRHPEAARAARDRVIERTRAAGVLDPERAETARRAPVPTQRRALPALAPHMADRVRAEGPGPDGRLATTLDAGMQARLEALARRAVADHGAGRLSIAMVVADHRSGEVLASVGSAEYAPTDRQGFVDMTRAHRSPGSTLKPLVYAMAFDDGLAHPETMIDDAPIAFGSYTPENFDGAFRGPVSVAEALRLSLNVPVVALASEIGPARILAALETAGAEPRLPGGAPGLAITLGGLGVRAEGLTALYAGLASGGQVVELTHRPGTPRAVPGRLVSPEAAWQVGHILSGLAPPPNAPRIRLAYKTGTSYGHRDTWAVGFDGRYVVTVWMGRPDGTPVPGAFGAEMAAPILFEAFSRVTPDVAPLGPPPPGTLMLSHAALPRPLQSFRPRDAVFAAPEGEPELAFPPDGALVETGGMPLAVKIRDGQPPFTVMANGAPVLVQSHARDTMLDLPAPGHVTLSVIDAAGRAARAQVELR